MRRRKPAISKNWHRVSDWQLLPAGTGLFNRKAVDSNVVREAQELLGATTERPELEKELNAVLQIYLSAEHQWNRPKAAHLRACFKIIEEGLLNASKALHTAPPLVRSELTRRARMGEPDVDLKILENNLNKVAKICAQLGNIRGKKGNKGDHEWLFPTVRRLSEVWEKYTGRLPTLVRVPGNKKQGAQTILKGGPEFIHRMIASIAGPVTEDAIIYALRQVQKAENDSPEGTAPHGAEAPPFDQDGNL